MGRRRGARGEMDMDMVMSIDSGLGVQGDDLDAEIARFLGVIEKNGVEGKGVVRGELEAGQGRGVWDSDDESGGSEEEEEWAKASGFSRGQGAAAGGGGYGGLVRQEPELSPRLLDFCNRNKSLLDALAARNSPLPIPVRVPPLAPSPSLGAGGMEGEGEGEGAGSPFFHDARGSPPPVFGGGKRGLDVVTGGWEGGGG